MILLIIPEIRFNTNDNYFLYFSSMYCICFLVLYCSFYCFMPMHFSVCVLTLCVISAAHMSAKYLFQPVA